MSVEYVVCPAKYTDPFVCVNGNWDADNKCSCGEEDIHKPHGNCASDPDSGHNGCTCRPATEAEIASARLRGEI